MNTVHPTGWLLLIKMGLSSTKPHQMTEDLFRQIQIDVI